MNTLKTPGLLKPIPLALAAASLVIPVFSASLPVTYQSAVLADSPLAYYRLGDPIPADVAANRGSVGTTGNGTYRHDNANQQTLHRVAGALVGDGNAAA